MPQIGRTHAYPIARALLPPEPVSVIEFGCHDGRGKAYLGTTGRYLGLERSRRKTAPGVDVRTGFDFTSRTDIPSGFDVAICLLPPPGIKSVAMVWTMAKAVKETGLVLWRVKTAGERGRLLQVFKDVTIWRNDGVMVAECRGVRTDAEVAA